MEASQEQEVKLLGAYSSLFANRVIWALKLKGIDYHYEEGDLFNKSPLLLELNPLHKKVPVLIHRHKVIVESLTIIEYIDETWKQHPFLLPQDPYERAMARNWAKFGDEKVFSAALKAVSAVEEEEKEEAVKSAIEALEHIEGELKGKKFFGGETVGYLDIAMGWISHWLPVWEEVGSMTILEPIKFPNITAWTNHFTNHPLIKPNLPLPDKMKPIYLRYFKK